MAYKPHGSIYLRVRWLILKTLTVATGSVSTPDNGRFRIPRATNPYDYWALRRGGYEKAESQIIEEEFEPDHLIIDVGSNIGYMSRRAGKKLKPHGKLVCIEASPTLLPYLRHNMEVVRQTCDVEIVSAAIGAPEREGQLCDFHQRRNLLSSLGEVAKSEQHETVVKVRIRSLSSIVKQFDPDGEGFSLVCDAEGAEILILTKDIESLRYCRQIAIELHHPSQTGCDLTAEDMIRMLKQAGFVLRRVVEDTYYLNRSVVVQP